MYSYSLPKINKSLFEEAASELGVVKLEEIEKKTKIKKLREEKGLLSVKLVKRASLTYFEPTHSSHRPK